MGIAVEKVLEVSAWVNGLSGSTVIVPAFGVAALGCLSVAILIVPLMVSPLRWLAAVPAALGLALAAAPQRFDLYVDRSGIGAALRGRDGRLVLVGRSSAFTAEQWLKADGDARRASDPGIRAGPRCDPLGCIAEGPGGRLVALVEDRRAFAEDCGRVAIVVSRLTAPPSCAAATVIDAAFLKTHGATAIRFTAAGETIATAPAPGRTRPTARRSVATNQTDQLALNLDPVGAEHARLVARVCRLERDRGAAAAEALQRRLLVVDQRHDDVAGVRRLLAADDDEVALEDTGLDHRVAAHLERVVLAAGEELRRHRDRVAAVLDRRDRRAGSDAPHHRHHHRFVAVVGLRRRRRDRRLGAAGKPAFDDARIEAPAHRPVRHRFR